VGVTAILDEFAAEVGADDPVSCVGGRTQWQVGGRPASGTREVSAPAGVVAHEPAEMIVRVRAGTTLQELQSALAAGGQAVPLEAEDPGRATVGGILAVGRSGFRRLGLGPVRDAVLEVTAVSAAGELVRSGAPLVKNVTGYDLCRLFVGSLGTLAVMAEVVLRCKPRPEVESWWVGETADAFAIFAGLYRPLSVLWDGTLTWVGLAGYAVDVEDQARSVLGPGFAPAEGPPPAPGPRRRSFSPGALRTVADQAGGDGGWLAEVGVGVLHCTPDVAARLGSLPPPAPTVVQLHEAVKQRFDPHGRLNPGRSPLGAMAS
jgi:glycolate oxidase FAD binding subunit